jgi:hypothetical protein
VPRHQSVTEISVRPRVRVFIKGVLLLLRPT